MKIRCLNNLSYYCYKYSYNFIPNEYYNCKYDLGSTYLSLYHNDNNGGEFIMMYKILELGFYFDVEELQRKLKRKSKLKKLNESNL